MSDAYPTQRLTFFVKVAELAQRNATAPILERHGLSYAQLALLLSVAREARQSGADLARLHGITAQSAGEVIAALARMGLVARAAGGRHARALGVHLTEQGETTVAAIRPELDAIDAALTAGISDDDLAAARRVLAAVAANASDHSED